jgi:Flp pilus assembly secretin CpaC/tetratricopeptide (TPR) repeat protein
MAFGAEVRAVTPAPQADAEGFAEQEVIRLQEKERLGTQHLQLGRQYYGKRDYTQALAEFTKALNLIPAVEKNTRLLDEARKYGVRSALALARTALQDAQDIDGLQKAKAYVDQALQMEPGNNVAVRLAETIQQRLDRATQELTRPTGPVKDPEFLQQQELVKDLFAQGRSYYLAEDYEEADKKFSQALGIDPYHLPSLRYKRMIQSKIYDFKSHHRSLTVQERITQVRDKWNEPIRRDLTIPEGEITRQPGVSEGSGPILEKLENIVIPVLKYTEEDVSAVIDYIVEQSRLIDPEGEGVNIVLSTGNQRSTGAAGQADEFGDPYGGFEGQDPFATGGFEDPTMGGGMGTNMEGGYGAPGAGMGYNDPYGAGGMGGMGAEMGGAGAYGAPNPYYPMAGSGQGTAGYQDPYATGGRRPIPPVTLNLRNVTVMSAIQLICELANLKYRVEPASVIITRADEVVGAMVTRLYPVEVGIFRTIFQPNDGSMDSSGMGTMGGGLGGGMSTGGGGGSTGDFRSLTASARGEMENIRAFFYAAGVPMPPGSSITYNERISTLIARNTASNLEVLERVLQAINIRPSQVEIEAKFVEVTQTDVEELGFEWRMDDNYEIFLGEENTLGILPISGQKRLQINSVPGEGSLDANTRGITGGIRFWNDLPAITEESTTRDNLFSISSIMTNPEFTFLIRALDQRGTTEVLSSPKVLTVVGQGAQIEVVQEFRYPTEWEDSSSGGGGGGFGGGGSGSSGSSAVFYPPIPSQIETRELGVLLNVTPLVGPDNWTINLTLIPEVSSFDRFIDYGGQAIIATSGGASVFGSGGQAGFASVDVPYLQPIFNSRNVTTTIQVWDGQTVVLGGLITDETYTINDKVPLLGDIPLFGRLFRSDVEQSTKRNLLIFVTARLVDPAGNPIHSQEDIDFRALSGTDLTTEAATSLGF